MQARRALVAEVAAAAIVGAYSARIQHRVGPRARIATNLVAAAGVVAFARAAGVSRRELGIEPARFRSGLAQGLAIAVPIGATVAGVFAIPQARALLRDPKITEASDRAAAFELFVRIPWETALAEELIFRSAFLGTALRSRSRALAIASSSALFGLWHIAPTLHALDRGTGGKTGAHRRVTVPAVVAATTAAGAGLAMLRLHCEHVAAPTVVHATINMVAYARMRT
jgi:membrane protease YdiL (CAAX protease family)